MNLLHLCMARAQKPQLRCEETQHSICVLHNSSCSSRGRKASSSPWQCHSEHWGAPKVMMEELKSPVEAGVGNRADTDCEDHVQSLSLDNSVRFPGYANIRQFLTVFYCLHCKKKKKKTLAACPFSPEPFLTKEQVCVFPPAQDMALISSS